MTFAEFAENIKTSFGASCTDSFLNPVHTWHVTFKSNPESQNMLKLGIPVQYQISEEEVISITRQFGLNPNFQRHLAKTAEIICIRKSWVFLQQAKIINLSKAEISLLFSAEITIDLAILAISFNHPWIHKRIYQIQNEDHPDPSFFGSPEEISAILKAQRSLTIRDPNDPYWLQHIEEYKQTKKEEEARQIYISYWIAQFESEHGKFRSFDEAIAHSAELDIKNAKQKLVELHAEYTKEKEKQEAIIRKAKKPIARYQARNKKTNEEELIEIEQDINFKKDIFRKFTNKWIASLTEVLELESSAALAKLTNIDKMTWWRWQNGKIIPSYSTLSKIVNGENEMVIKSGKCAGEHLKNLPTVPKLTELLSLREYI